jgi:hypothetical protein
MPPMNQPRDIPRKQDEVEDGSLDPFRIASRKLVTILRQNLAPIRHAVPGETYDGIMAAIEDIEGQ